MKKTLVILLSSFILISLFGCTHNENSTIDTSTDSNVNKDVKYTIEQIYFSKSFQSIVPSIDAKEINNKKTISLNLGLSQYSEISIDDIKLVGNVFNVYISGYKDNSISSLSVPQIILELNDDSIKNIKNMDFNIIYNDYDYIDIKFKINDVLNKLESEFKLALNSCPSFNLVRQDDKIIWEITYNNIISREDNNYPLINLYAQVDANTGEILGYEKHNMSSIIDTGTILHFNDDIGFLYEKIIDNKKDDKRHELWFFDSIKEEKSMIYNCHFPILSPAISSDLSNIAFIEKTDSSSNAYVYSNNDSKIYKLQFEKEFNPTLIRWSTNDLLYLLENKKDKSLIYSYDLKTNDVELVLNTNKGITNIVICENGFIISENIDKLSNKLLSFTEDFKEFKTISEGFNPKFINKSTIGYLENDEKTDISHLILYDIEEEKVISVIKEDILNYKFNNSNDILYVRNNLKDKDFTLSSYSLDLNTSFDIVNIIDKNVYYNNKQDLIYLNIGLPFENENLNIIYSIKLDTETKNP